MFVCIEVPILCRFDSIKPARQYYLFSTSTILREEKKSMPRNSYLPFSLFIKGQMINVHSHKGRRLSGQKDKKQRGEMSLRCVVQGGGLLGELRSRTGFGVALVTRAINTQCARNGGMSWSRLCPLRNWQTTHVQPFTITSGLEAEITSYPLVASFVSRVIKRGWFPKGLPGI